MSDNEIINALELCNRGICKGCSFYDVECCIAECRKEALDLINRQKAEIERLVQKNAIAQSEAIKNLKTYL